MTLAELIRDIAYLNPGWRPSDIQQRARLLREARRLPHGGRGQTAPNIWPAHAATLLIGLTAAERAVEVVEAVDEYGRLVPNAKVHDFPKFPSFHAALTALLEDQNLAKSVVCVTVCRSWPQVAIAYRRAGKKGKKSHSETYRPQQGLPDRRDLVRVDVLIQPPLLMSLGLQLGGVSAP